MNLRDYRKYKHESASAMLVHQQNRDYRLVDLYSHEKKRGHAKALMRKIIKDADIYGWTLILTVQQNGRGGMNNKQLAKFYESFGFVLLYQQLGTKILPMKYYRVPSQDLQAS